MRSGRYHRSADRLALTATQNQTINQIAQGLPPNSRHSFLLRVSRTLRLSAQAPGFVTDILVGKAIEKALAEVAT